jgi:hypothetical protein
MPDRNEKKPRPTPLPEQQGDGEPENQRELDRSGAEPRNAERRDAEQGPGALEYPESGEGRG